MQTKLKETVFFFTLKNSLVVNLGCCLLSDCFPQVKKRVYQDSHGERCTLGSSFLLWSSIDSLCHLLVKSIVFSCYVLHFASECWNYVDWSIVKDIGPLAYCLRLMFQELSFHCFHLID